MTTRRRVRYPPKRRIDCSQLRRRIIQSVPEEGNNIRKCNTTTATRARRRHDERKSTARIGTQGEGQRTVTIGTWPNRAMPF